MAECDNPIKEMCNERITKQSKLNKQYNVNTNVDNIRRSQKDKKMKSNAIGNRHNQTEQGIK